MRDRHRWRPVGLTIALVALPAIGSAASQADLAITNSDGQATAVPGTSVTYTIVTANAGPDGAAGATITDTVPGTIVGASWTCAGAGGGTCTAAGSGDIGDVVNLPVGATVTYTLRGTVSAAATGTLSNTASVTAPGGVSDPNPGNNSATDTDTLTPQANLTITKTDGQASAVPGTSVTYTIVASNAGPSAVSGAKIMDTVPAAMVRPTLAQHVASSANPVGVGIPGKAFRIPLPNAVGPGNCLVLGISYEWPATRTVTITDDNGNAWPSAAVTANPGWGVASAVYVLPNANAGATTITVTFDAAVIPFQYAISEFYDVATVSPVNGTSSTVAGAGPGLATGGFTPGDNDANGGNLVWSYFALAQPAAGNPSLWTPGPGFTLLDADIAWNTNQGYPHASEYSVQTTAATIDPGITAAGDTDSFNCLSVALKAAAAGTAPPAGIQIARIVHMTSNVPPANATWKLQFPTIGNLIVLAMNENSPVIDVTGIADSKGNTYTRRENDLTEPQIWHTANSTPDTDLTITLTISGTPATASVVAYDIVGADPSPFDVVAGVPATTFNNQTHVVSAPSITPTTTNGLVIAAMGMGQGPVTGLDAGSPAGAFFDLVTYAGETDLDLMENADAKGHLYNTDLTPESWNWVGFSAPSNSYGATAVAFKAASSPPPTPGPPAAGVTWTCAGAGGATCTPSGSGDIDDIVNLPVGGSVTYTLTGTVDPWATGTLSNTATVTAPPGVSDPVPGDNSATDTDILTPQADLAITKTDGQATALAGTPLTYTIVATNAGPSAADGVTVTDTVPSALTAATWTCVGSRGGTCAANGTANINDTVRLPPGAAVRYALSGTVTPSSSRLSNTATITAPNGVADPNLANNTATDTDLAVCGNVIVVVPDGRLGQATVPATAPAWFGATVKPGDSYSVEIKSVDATSVPGTLMVYKGDDPCVGPSTLGTTDTSAIDPSGPGGLARQSFTAVGSETFYEASFTNGTGAPLTITFAWSDTTMFSPAWSTNGSFDTFYSLQNTTGIVLSGTLTLLDTAGLAVGSFPISIQGGHTSSLNTSSLGVPRNRTGAATFVHNGPPGAIVAEAAIASFAIRPAYVQPVRFQAVREAR